MLRYNQLNIAEGGPWFGSVAVPGLPTEGVATPAGRALPKEDIISGISRIGKTESDENVALTGGEPLGHPDIGEIAAALRAAGYKRILARTDGRRLADTDFLASVLMAGVSLFEVMMSERAEKSRSLRGLKNVRRISECEKLFANVYLSVVVPVGRDNYEGLIGSLDSVLRMVEVDRVVFCWGEPGFPIWQAGENIQKAIEFCGVKRVWAVTRGIPACVAPEAAPHIEEMFDVGPQERLLRIPPVCAGCSLHGLCARMPGTDLNYSWEPKPIAGNRHSPFVNDILEKGFVFDKENARLYGK